MTCQVGASWKSTGSLESPPPPRSLKLTRHISPNAGGPGRHAVPPAMECRVDPTSEQCLRAKGLIVSIGIWVVLQIRVPLRGPLIRVPYYIGDLKRDLNLENYPFGQPLPFSTEPSSKGWTHSLRMFGGLYRLINSIAIGWPQKPTDTPKSLCKPKLGGPRAQPLP